ncbi:MAG: 23S rRNA (uracil(1939)-C(5))-methyltransferase RlmD [Thermoleophilia bacterium]|nr:23S rRNA (uracil(1939)-C(5))-methyltransferase RlmD [Thermoleophilia bacterium]
MNKPVKNQEIEVSIDSLAFGGRGVARVNGFVVFVEGAVPGDVVRALVTASKRSYAEARSVEVLAPSRQRIQPACAHFGVCGGCSWQSLPYETQLEFKQKQVGDCLKRIGGVEEPPLDEPLGAAPLWRYRNKVEFSFAPAPGAGIDLGFHRPGEWQRVINIDDCVLHSQLTNKIRNLTRELVRESGLEAYDPRSGAGFFRHLVLREGANTGEVMVNLVTAPGEFPEKQDFARRLTTDHPEIASLVWSVNSTKASVATGFPFQVLAGRDHIFEEIRGLRLKVSPSSFLQTNTHMAERLYRKAVGYAGLRGEELVFDLYCGIGSISLLLARGCREVFGIEIMEEAVILARENTRANGAENAGFAVGKVRKVLKDLGLRRRPDVVVMDPPRAGASKKEVQRILEIMPSRIVYVSCNASTLAGNAAQLVEGGYRLLGAGAVDMFPHTPHIEVVALFEVA